MEKKILQRNVTEPISREHRRLNQLSKAVKGGMISCSKDIIPLSKTRPKDTEESFNADRSSNSGLNDRLSQCTKRDKTDFAD
ncbi:hypothetical protein NPIL_43881 [Nephila pilipes]|uniref:Uncharacterized protein n=1 Tax=Nephila pilipes TaxID=299642 RepID=A0A8X6T4G8_NEPPI|nr:hypothetical protein NPIL_43881 [Nephila pilipes]